MRCKSLCLDADINRLERENGNGEWSRHLGREYRDRLISFHRLRYSPSMPRGKSRKLGKVF